MVPLVVRDFKEDMGLGIIMEVLEASTSEVGLARVVVTLMVSRVANRVVNRVVATRKKTSRKVVETNTMQAIIQVADRKGTKDIRSMRLTIREMLGRKAARYRKGTTRTRRVRRKVTTMKPGNTVNITKALRATLGQATVRRAAIRRDTRQAVITTCITRTNTKRNIPFTMTLTRVGMRANMASLKRNTPLPKEVMRREVTLTLLIMKRNTERRDNTRRDNTSTKKRDIKERKVTKAIMIIRRIFPRREAIAKVLHMDIVAVMVLVAAMVAMVMVVDMDISELSRQGSSRISRLFRQIYSDMRMGLRNCVCICLTLLDVDITGILANSSSRYECIKHNPVLNPISSCLLYSSTEENELIPIGENYFVQLKPADDEVNVVILRLTIQVL
jgi:hypothetical protein